MKTDFELKVKDTFTITGRGLVVLLDGQTGLSAGKPHLVEIVTPEGNRYKTEAFKEWLLKRDPAPIEEESFLLINLSKKEVPIGSVITFAE